ncbi:MAG: Succinyl-diaminopimelate desuccinylase [Candidatus Heimdallarchaeota archaeon LC_2]|nr:MAG: Succinyl-diaminopimelate desuccinylase [Candidatus Heimdallarchaeota archaeon LC_2]
MRNQILNWLDEIDYLSELSDYIALPSRSRNQDETKIAGDFALRLLEKSGLQTRRIPSSGNDVLFGHSLSDPKNPSVLLYGHYDVQPEGDIDLWNTPPFEATKIGDKLFGRGSADNKGQHYAHLMGLRYFKENYPEEFNKVNIKFILDGDEELGSFSLPAVVEQNKELLMADFVIVSDGPSLIETAPTIVGGVRGIVSFQIKIKHNKIDLHSGNFGGVGRSATFDALNLVRTMIDESGKVLIDGFYDDIEELSELEKTALKNLEPVYNKIISDRDITPAIRVNEYSHPFLNEAWPTLNINGLLAGGVKNERRTIIPSETYLSIDCRLVSNQNPEKISRLIKDHIIKWSKTNGIENAIEIDMEGTMAPSTSSLNSKFLNIIQEATRKGFGVEPVLVPRLGGSLPIQLFPRILDRPVFLIPYALADENNHSPNENLDLNYFKSGVITSVELMKLLASKVNDENL